MKVTVHRGALVEVLALASGVVPARSPKPVLGCVKLSTVETPNGKALRVLSTDNEIALETTLGQCDVKREGSVLLPASKLLEIINNSPDDTVVIDSDAQKTTIKGSDSKFVLLGYNPEEFPPISGFEGNADVDISAGMLKALLDRSRFAAAKEMSRYAINGVMFERKGRRLTLVATDGHRLALAKEDLPVEGPDFSNVVPIKAITLIERLLTDPEQKVELQFRENRLFARVSHGGDGDKKPTVATAVLSTVLVEGVFPNYNDVIPKDSDRKATLKCERFASAVRRASLLTNEESKGVKLSFQAKELVLSSRAAEVGEATVEMPIELHGEPLDIGFNPQYLQDALKVCPTEDVTLDLKTANKPGILRSGHNFLYVIMPVSLNL